MTQTKVMGNCLFVALILTCFVTGVAGCGGSGGANPARVDVAANEQNAFIPQNIVVARGTQVVWSNTASHNHTVIADPQDPVAGGPNSDASQPAGIPPQGQYSWTVPGNAASGTIWYYHCRIHGTAGNGHDYGSGMVGVIVVR
jgi:plastocyanin